MALFLLGEDTIEDVRKIRKDARASLGKGKVTSWSVEGASVQKVLNMSLADVIEECNEFLRVADPKIRRANPFRDRTRTFII
jgi:hypothetical protein